MSDMPDRIMVWPLAGPEKPIAEKEPRWLYRATDSNCFDDIPAPCAEKYLRSNPTREHAGVLRNLVDNLICGDSKGYLELVAIAEDVLATIKAEERRDDSQTKECWNCHGTGIEPDSPYDECCATCNGDGIVQRKEDG